MVSLKVAFIATSIYQIFKGLWLILLANTLPKAYETTDKSQTFYEYLRNDLGYRLILYSRSVTPKRWARGQVISAVVRLMLGLALVGVTVYMLNSPYADYFNYRW